MKNLTKSNRWRITVALISAVTTVVVALLTLSSGENSSGVSKTASDTSSIGLDEPPQSFTQENHNNNGVIIQNVNGDVKAINQKK